MVLIEQPDIYFYMGSICFTAFRKGPYTMLMFIYMDNN
jgi:hypothetical protein